MRFGAKRTLIPSLVFIGAGMLFFARTPIDGSYVVGAIVLAAALAIAATVLLPEGAAKPAPAERERDGARSDAAYSMA